MQFEAMNISRTTPDVPRSRMRYAAMCVDEDFAPNRIRICSYNAQGEIVVYFTGT
jgi:hypothetical protein